MNLGYGLTSVTDIIEKILKRMKKIAIINKKNYQRLRAFKKHQKITQYPSLSNRFRCERTSDAETYLVRGQVECA